MNNRAILEGATSLTPPSIAFSNQTENYEYCDDDGQYDEMCHEQGSEFGCEDTRSVSDVTAGVKRKSDDNNNEAVASSTIPNANNVIELFRQGMEEEQYNQLTKDEVNARPSNCDGLVVVKFEPAAKEIEECSRIGYKLQYGRSGFRPRVRAGMSHGAFRGRGAYVPADGPWPTNSQRRGE
ncbi:hypothetical protein DPMN_177333 [Dreissena polymorpha]|uniref:Uncharacterized protein n=1 Tax=Dreissena polymorpha TaxID=45954 RepID=A0A9D4ILI3_DREPO|nr:hypothetical protein DPMN_177333 [Dreissena polymorpha]